MGCCFNHGRGDCRHLTIIRNCSNVVRGETAQLKEVLVVHYLVLDVVPLLSSQLAVSWFFLLVTSFDILPFKNGYSYNQLSKTSFFSSSPPPTADVLAVLL